MFEVSTESVGLVASSEFALAFGFLLRFLSIISTLSKSAPADSMRSGMVVSSSTFVKTKPRGRGESGERGEGSMKERKKGVRGCVLATSLAMVSISLSVQVRGRAG